MKPTRTYPRLHTDTAHSNALGQAGGLLLTETVHTSGLGHPLKQAMTPWKKPFAIHNPAKILTDLAITLALGGDAEAAINTTRELARARVWKLAGAIHFVESVRVWIAELPQCLHRHLVRPALVLPFLTSLLAHTPQTG